MPDSISVPHSTAADADAGSAVPELERRVLREQNRLLYEQGHMATLTGLPFALLLGALMTPTTPVAQVAAWLGLRVAIVLARTTLWAMHRRAADQTHPRWTARFFALLGIDGLLWGLAGTWLLPGDRSIDALLLGSLVGVAAVGVFVLQSRLAANLVFTVPLLVPAAALQFARGDRFGVYAAIGLAMFLPLMGAEGRRAEQRIRELLRLRFTTEHIAAERADALALAQRHSAVKSQFLATMSHEMRTPLHGLLGVARLLRAPQALQDPQALERLGLIERSGEHLLRLINDVLDVSRIEAGQMTLDARPFDLTAVIHDVTALAAASAAHKGLGFEVDLHQLVDRRAGRGSRAAPTACWWIGDPARVRQLLHNLIGNAVKFTERGRVRVVARREADASLVIEVHDTGIGIAPSELPHIFEAFHQADASFDRRYAGTGLGLTIARELARAMHGDVVARSVSGQGSVFSVTLRLGPAVAPRAARRADDRPPARAASDAPTGGLRPAGPLRGRVLLAEDNEVNALVATAMLERAGLDVAVVSDGAMAVRHCVEGAPDLVLMDCQMPVMDGFEATARIRNDERTRHRPRVTIVALTANAYQADRDRCLAVGMDDHLAKPFREDQLLSVLHRHLPAALRH